MAFDRIVKVKRDETVEELVEQVTGVLEGVADELWVEWVERLIPGVA